jgi:hypothetical protein
VPLSVAGRRYIPRMTLCHAAFLEERLPLRAFATLTMPYDVSQMAMDDAFRCWTACVQSHNRLTIGWIRAFEPDPQRHIHAVLLAMDVLNCDHAALIWRELVARRYPLAAKVEPYRYGVGGLAYVLKSLDRNTEDIQFSENLSAFVPNSAFRFFGSNAAERRHIRRIHSQSAAIPRNN